MGGSTFAWRCGLSLPRRQVSEHRLIQAIRVSPGFGVFEQFEAERFDLPEHAEHSRAVHEQAGLYKGGDHVCGSGQLLPIIDELADRLEPQHGIAPRRGRDRRAQSRATQTPAPPRCCSARWSAPRSTRRCGRLRPWPKLAPVQKDEGRVTHTGSEGRPAQDRPPPPARDRATVSQGLCAVRIGLRPSRGSRCSCCQSPIGG